MVFLDDLKEMTLYKKPFVLPIDEENIRKGSAIFLVSPNAETSKAMMNYPYMINKMNTFNGYYLEKNANYYINQEGNLIPIDRDDEYLHEVSEEELEEGFFNSGKQKKQNSSSDYNDFLHKNYATESEWKAKYRSDFIATYKACIRKAESIGKLIMGGQAVKDGLFSYPDLHDDWPSSEMIKYMDRYEGGPNDRKSGVCLKSLVVVETNFSGYSPKSSVDAILNKIEKDLNDCIPAKYKDESQKMFFRIKRFNGGNFMLIANSIIMHESVSYDKETTGITESEEEPEPEPYCMKESRDNSKYSASFKKKTGKNFKYIQFPGAEAERYLSKDTHWNKESIDDFKKRKAGEVAIDTDADEVAGWIFVNKSGTVGPLRVYDEYKGYGISNVLVSDAVNKYKGKELGVYSDNEIALNVYKKNGFRTYKTKTYKDGDKVYIMKLESKLTEEDKKLMEAFNEAGEEGIEEEYTYYNNKKYKKVPKSANLYHGSRTQNLKELTPKNDSISRVGNATAVYASKDKRFAACYGTAWRDDIAKQGTWDKWNTVVMGISDKVIMDQPCSLYELENDGSFIEISDKEVISLNSIKVKKEYKYSSYAEMLKQNGVKVISYDEYIKNVKSPNPEFHYLNEDGIDENEFEYSNTFSDVMKVVNSLPKKDLLRICNGRFKDSPYVIYREVLSVSGSPVAFIDVYKLPNMEEDGCIVLATNPKWRGKGLASMLVERMKHTIGDKNLVWKTQQDNDASLAIANANGYSPVFDEAALYSKERNVLSDSDFGIPSLRKYPLTDAQHVKSAIRFFNYVDKEHEAELAKNIKRKAIEFKVPIRCGEGNRLSKYITEEYVQEFISVASIGNDMTAVCNGTIRQHMSQGDMVYSFDNQKPYTKKTKKKKEEPVTESEDNSLPSTSESEGSEDVFLDDMIKDIEKFCNEEP